MTTGGHRPGDDTRADRSDTLRAGTIRLVVFDLDGTLVDSRQDLAESANEVLVHYGGTPHTEDAVARMIGDGAPTLVARVFAAAGLPQPPDALARFLTIYNARSVRSTKPYPGVREALQSLAGRFALAVLTNKPRASTEVILEGLSLSSYFESMVVAGDGPFPRKPDPAGLNHLMTCVGASADQTLLVGDSAVDWRTARAARTWACIVRYGFGFAGFPSNETNDRERIIENLEEMLAML